MELSRVMLSTERGHSSYVGVAAFLTKFQKGMDRQRHFIHRHRTLPFDKSVSALNTQQDIVEEQNLRYYTPEATSHDSETLWSHFALYHLKFFSLTICVDLD